MYCYYTVGIEQFNVTYAEVESVASIDGKYDDTTHEAQGGGSGDDGHDMFAGSGSVAAYLGYDDEDDEMGVDEQQFSPTNQHKVLVKYPHIPSLSSLKGSPVVSAFGYLASRFETKGGKSSPNPDLSDLHGSPYIVPSLAHAADTQAVEVDGGETNLFNPENTTPPANNLLALGTGSGENSDPSSPPQQLLLPSSESLAPPHNDKSDSTVEYPLLPRRPLRSHPSNGDSASFLLHQYAASSLTGGKLRDDTMAVPVTSLPVSLLATTLSAADTTEGTDISTTESGAVEAAEDGGDRRVEDLVYSSYGRSLYGADEGDPDRMGRSWASGDGRLCVLPHQKDASGSNLPACSEGHHRMLPALVTPSTAVVATGLESEDDQSTRIQLPYFVQPHLYESRLSPKTARLLDPRASGDHKKRPLSTRILLTLRSGIKFLSDTFAMALTAVLLLAAMLYLLHRQGLLSAASLLFLYKNTGIQLLHLTLLDTVLPGFMAASKSGSDPTPLSTPPPSSEEVQEEDDAYGNKLTRIGSLLLTQQVLGYGRYVTHPHHHTSSPLMPFSYVTCVYLTL